jgi:hypothetical protein
MEELDEAVASNHHRDALRYRLAKMKAPEAKLYKVAVRRADALVLELCEKFAFCWSRVTGGPLTSISARVAQKCGPGRHRSDRAKYMLRHPLWLMLDAAGLKIGAGTVNQIVSVTRLRC